MPIACLEMEYQPLETGDGSLTYAHPVHGASYRSVRGARTESSWVFLQGTRLTERQEAWHVLELGFGSGLNFALTCEAAISAGVPLRYVSTEPQPMPSELWLVDDRWKALSWGAPLVHERVELTVHKKRWQDYLPPQDDFDAVYFDPFGPAVAPDCWTCDCFAWALRALKPSGVLATYGASSAARRAMQQAGLWVGVRPGAPGKREMTVASKSAETLAHAKLWKAPR